MDYAETSPSLFIRFPFAMMGSAVLYIVRLNNAVLGRLHTFRQTR